MSTPSYSKHRLPWVPAAEGLRLAVDSVRNHRSAESHELNAYLEQLREEGLCMQDASQLLMTWDSVCRLLSDTTHADSLHLLDLPAVTKARPRLSSSGAVSDAGFTVVVDGWLDGSGLPMRHSIERIGGALLDGSTIALLEEPAWEACKAIDMATAEWPELDIAGRWASYGKLRELAVATGALLDDYLERTVAVSPTTVALQLNSSSVAGIPVIAVEPQLPGTPESWLATFDRYDQVQPRYDVLAASGDLVRVTPSKEVRSVLQAIKSMPGRRVASEKARELLRNPFAVLGDDAVAAIDEEQWQTAVQQSGFTTVRIVLAPHRDNRGQIESVIAALMDSATGDPVEEEVITSVADVDQLAKSVRRSVVDGLPLCSWRGHEIEMQPDGATLLIDLASIALRWRTPTLGMKYEDVFDLSEYSDRVVGIEDAAVIVAPYVARISKENGWIPENTGVGISIVDTTTGATERIQLTEAGSRELQERVDAARAAGIPTVQIPGSDRKVGVETAASALADIRQAQTAIGEGRMPRAVTRNPVHTGRAPVLKILHNIEVLEYQPSDGSKLGPVGTRPKCVVPAGLQHGMSLLPHQEDGLARMQYLVGKAGRGVSGCLLADDMGLGKTLQCLALAAWHMEVSPVARPSLIVAPVSLLENWRIETERFFGPTLAPVLSLYGESLGAVRAPKGNIDPLLERAGVRKLLRRGFEQGYRIVLTTYETLRDFEFSIARVHWGLVVCDEAQKIKNPAALATRAAKALRCDFRVVSTGTPVENSLGDLWCLMDFAQPGYLGSLREFTRDYRKTIEMRAEGHEDCVKQLRGGIDPFVIRRTKEQVAVGLPAKRMRELADPEAMSLPMSALQRQLYRQALQHLHALRKQVQQDRSAGTAVLQAIHQLRVICSNPLGALGAGKEDATLDEHLSHSPKLAWLLSRLATIRSRGEKVILFTELREVQRLLQRAVRERFGLQPSIINGDTSVDIASTESRQHLIDAFQQTDGFNVIILSPIAVGFGVNIQAANHVVHFTRHWNPAKEDQATDRAYRIGQTRDVFVYCPTVVGDGFESFDQRLDALLERKRMLSRDMLAPPEVVTTDDFSDL